MTCSSVGIVKRPLKRWERSASGWIARRVLISRSVKSDANQPVSSAPSTIIVRLRSANSGCDATSVVVVMFGSWRAISRPSFVATRSGSM